VLISVPLRAADLLQLLGKPVEVASSVKFAAGTKKLARAIQVSPVGSVLFPASKRGASWLASLTQPYFTCRHRSLP
jgi:hypothetical protein